MFGKVHSLSANSKLKCNFETLSGSSFQNREARWPSGRASDSGARGRGFNPHSGRRVVSLSKIHLPPKSTGNTQEAVAPNRHD